MFVPFHHLAERFAAAAAARWGRLRRSISAPPRPRNGLPLWDPQADARARELLLRMLNPDQRAHYAAHGSFTVHVPGRGTFCILPRTTYNVVQLSSGDTYCCVCETPVPLPDLMLAQKLMLEREPERFFSTANRVAAHDLFTTQLDFSGQTRAAAGGGDWRHSRVRCSMLSMIPHVGYLL